MTGAASGANTGAKERFVGVDVADTMQEFLVQERGLDRRLAFTEEADEQVKVDAERFGAGTAKATRRFSVGANDGQASESSGIDEAQFSSRRKFYDGVSVGCEIRRWFGNDEATGHAEVDDPLCRLLA